MSLFIPYTSVSSPPTLYGKSPGWRALHSRYLRPTHACHRSVSSRQSLKVVPAETLSHCIEKEKSFSRKGLITLEAVIYLLQQRGLAVRVREFGPVYRLTCVDAADDEVLAESHGFVAPLFGLMHCDSLRAFTKGMRGEKGRRARSGLLGLGTLMGIATLCLGYERGCPTAEILAIRDDDAQHRRLVRYYERVFGFVALREVGGNGLRDLPDLLVWGGQGARMNGDIRSILRRWTPALLRSLQKRSDD